VGLPPAWATPPASCPAPSHLPPAQRKRRLSCLAPPAALEGDAFEALTLLPGVRNAYGFPELLASLASGRVVVSRVFFGRYCIPIQDEKHSFACRTWPVGAWWKAQRCRVGTQN
jgi:hypothetical protein